MKRTVEILAVRFAAIGDVITITPALAALRQAIPHAEIDMLVGRLPAQMLQNNPHLRRIISFDEKGVYRRRPDKLAELLRLLRRKRYEAVIAFHRSPTTLLMLTLARAKQRFAYSCGKLIERVYQTSPFLAGRSYSLNALELVRLAVKQLGGRSEDIHPQPARIYLTAPELARARQTIHHLGLSGRTLVGLCAGGGSNPGEAVRVRQWPAENFDKLLQYYHRKQPHWRFLLLGDDNDAEVSEYLASRNTNCVNLAARTTLRQCAAILKQCGCFLSGDTGLMHVAAAVGTPVVAIAGPTDPADFFPLLAPGAALTARLPCQPCYRRGRFVKCVMKNSICTAQVGVEQVCESIERVLETVPTANTLVVA